MRYAITSLAIWSFLFCLQAESLSVIYSAEYDFSTEAFTASITLLNDDSSTTKPADVAIELTFPGTTLVISSDDTSYFAARQNSKCVILKASELKIAQASGIGSFVDKNVLILGAFLSKIEECTQSSTTRPVDPDFIKDLQHIAKNGSLCGKARSSDGAVWRVYVAAKKH